MVLSVNFFKRFLVPLLPWLGLVSFCCGMVGLYLGLFWSPADYRQGEIVRIMYIHVPAAWMALGVYLLMAVLGAVNLITRNVIAGLMLSAATPVGAVFAFVCLVTGSIWGRGTWGTWWVWDARLTSMLILFLFYLGCILLRNFLAGSNREWTALSILAVLGAINLPIVKFSVDIWTTLHQPASILRNGGVAIDASMLYPLLTMFVSFASGFGFVWIMRIVTVINQHKLMRNGL